MARQFHPLLKTMTSASTAADRRSRHLIVRILLWLVWVAYVGYLLLSDFPPGPALLHLRADVLQEVLALSANFWFLLPAVAPELAPALNPVLEGLFNFTIAWGLLFFGFLLDGRGQRWPMLPFLVGTAFLTNVFYLPWLALRRPQPAAPADPLSTLERVAESRIWPALLLVVAALSPVWALLARPEFGDWAQRWAEFVDILQRDRLAYSFVFDLGVFWLFQSALVADDMARRHWQAPKVLWLVRLVPFLGLAVYLLGRPRCGSKTRQKKMGHPAVPQKRVRL